MTVRSCDLSILDQVFGLQFGPFLPCSTREIVINSWGPFFDAQWCLSEESGPVSEDLEPRDTRISWDHVGAMAWGFGIRILQTLPANLTLDFASLSQIVRRPWLP